MKDKIQVTITPEDCKGAEYENPGNCPLARAIKRSTKIMMVYVGDITVNMNHIRYRLDDTEWNDTIMKKMIKNNNSINIVLIKIPSYEIRAKAKGGSINRRA